MFAGRSERDWASTTEGFLQSFERDAHQLGLPLSRQKLVTCTSDMADISSSLADAADSTDSFVLVMLGCDCYNNIKLAADNQQVISQCVKWKNVVRPPSSYFANVLLKVNTKLGGVNHTLTSRLPKSAWPTKVFQSPPASISWVFDRPCMLLGIDVSHPESGMQGASVAAVVSLVIAIVYLFAMG